MHIYILYYKQHNHVAQVLWWCVESLPAGTYAKSSSNAFEYIWIWSLCISRLRWVPLVCCPKTVNLQVAFQNSPMSICILFYQFDQAYSEVGNTCPTQLHVWGRRWREWVEIPSTFRLGPGWQWRETGTFAASIFVFSFGSGWCDMTWWFSLYDHWDDMVCSLPSTHGWKSILRNGRGALSHAPAAIQGQELKKVKHWLPSCCNMNILDLWVFV